MNLPLNLDHITHIAEVFAVLGVCWRIVRGLNRILDVLKDFPPHTHANGLIIYPKGFEPSRVAKLKVQE